MAVDDQDIFGKIDALLEKRAGFGTDTVQRHLDDDFPLLTEVVQPQTGQAFVQERRQGERRQGDRRQGDRRKGTLGRLDIPRSTLTEEQFNRFLAEVEHKLEDLFIRQQLRIEEAIRRVLSAQGENCRSGASDPL